MNETNNILTISQLNQRVAKLLEHQIPLIWVQGEIASITQASSGHWYLTLKDGSSSVKAVMFRQRSSLLGFVPKVGDQLDLRVKVTLYAPRGDYQLQVEFMRYSGQGGLFEAFVRLKDKLMGQGLFDPERKRPLPRFPRTIGLITSLQAAALHDVLSAFERRAPHVSLIVYPSLVQGPEASQQLIQAIQLANQRAEVDLLLLVRGGGSLEDLWCFNDEALAYSIASSHIPMISGVGHETDTTIADFVADKRAPTPTAAAELACTEQSVWISTVMQHAHRVQAYMSQCITDHEQAVDGLAIRLLSPSQQLKQHALGLLNHQQHLTYLFRQQFQKKKFQLKASETALTNLLPNATDYRPQLTQASYKMVQINQRRLERSKLHLAHLLARLQSLDPQQILDRGYAIVRNQAGDIIRNANDLQLGARLDVALAQGHAQVEVLKTDADSNSSDNARILPSIPDRR